MFNESMCGIENEYHCDIAVADSACTGNIVLHCNFPKNATVATVRHITLKMTQIAIITNLSEVFFHQHQYSGFEYAAVNKLMYVHYNNTHQS